MQLNNAFQWATETLHTSTGQSTLQIFVGSGFGLQLVLNVERYQYMIGPNEEIGVKVRLHAAIYQVIVFLVLFLDSLIIPLIYKSRTECDLFVIDKKHNTTSSSCVLISWSNLQCI